MAHAARHQPSKIFKGTVDEVFSHRGEIPAGATLELKVFNPTSVVTPEGEEKAPENAMKPVKELRGHGILAGIISSEDFMRRKQEEIELEDRRNR